MTPELTPLPLAAASRRLREGPRLRGRQLFPGPAGRPRKFSRPEPGAPPLPGYAPSAGPGLARTAGADAPGTRPVIAPSGPRLFGVREAAHYLGVSAWSVREWVAAGTIPKVDAPCRRTLIDRQDLDALIDRWKERGR